MLFRTLHTHQIILYRYNLFQTFLFLLTYFLLFERRMVCRSFVFSYTMVLCSNPFTLYKTIRGCGVSRSISLVTSFTRTSIIYVLSNINSSLKEHIPFFFTGRFRRSIINALHGVIANQSMLLSL